MSRESEQQKPRRTIRGVDIVRLSLGAVGSNKLRSSLTILGVAIGVFSVVGVMTALSAMRQSIDSGLSFLGANVFNITREPAIQFSGGGDSWRRRPRITPSQAYAFKDMMDEESVPVSLLAYHGGQRARYSDRQTQPRITLVGTNEHFLMTNKYDLDAGRNLTDSDVEFARYVAVIGKEVQSELFPNQDPVGQTILMSGNRYTVVGTLVERGEIFGQSTDNIVLVPVSRFVANYWGGWRSMQMAVQAPSAVSMMPTQDLAIGRFRLARGLEPEDPNDFEITSNDSLQEAFGKIAAIVGTGGLLISAIALVCSGIGIMNIMLVSVTERTREIGVRKSIGARRRDVLIQFLLEAVLLSETGAVLGIAMGVIVGNVVAHFMKVPMLFPWMWTGIAVLVCSVIGVGFGLYPAWRAASLHPVDALRYE